MLLIYIQNGRDKFFQWDLNQRLVVVNEDVKELHFTNALTAEALITEVYELEGLKVADVPNILLQIDWDISVYGGCGECVREMARFKVEPRAKPSDYVYTETDVKNYDALEKRVAALEELGPGSVDLDDYYTKQETDTKIQEAQPDLSGYALKSEIPETPDLSEYALKTDIPDTSNFATKDEIPDVSGYALKSEIPDVSNFATKDEIPEEPDLSGYALKSEIPDTSNFITADDIPQPNIATKESAGIVKPDGTTINISGTGTISAFSATNSRRGTVMPDGTTLTISGGKLGANTATTSSLGVVKPDGTTITITEDGTISSVGGGGGGGEGAVKEWVWVPVPEGAIDFTLAANTRHLKIVCYIPSDGTSTTLDGEEYINNVCIDCFSSGGFLYEDRFYLGKVVSNGSTIDPLYIRNRNGIIIFYKRTGYAPYYEQITANDLTIVGYYYWGGSELLTQEDLDSELEGITNGRY